MKLIGFNTLTLVLAVLGAHAVGTTPQQEHFLRDAIRGDSSEIGLALMAQQRAVSPKVRELGVELVQDHMQARAEAFNVAHDLRVAAPQSLTPAALRERERLENVDGRAFDRAFLRHVIADRREDISDFTAQAHGRGPTATYAQRTLPTLVRHLQTAERLRREST